MTTMLVLIVQTGILVYALWQTGKLRERCRHLEIGVALQEQLIAILYKSLKDDVAEETYRKIIRLEGLVEEERKQWTSQKN